MVLGKIICCWKVFENFLSQVFCMNPDMNCCDLTQDVKSDVNHNKHTNSNWPFFSDGELGATANVLTAYMKQKHRLIWERRYGKLYGPEYDAKWAERPKSYLKLDKNV